MYIYTRTGDKGTTGLYDGRRVPKNDLRIMAVGTLDELVSFIGLARVAAQESQELSRILLEIQDELFVVGAEVATDDISKLKKTVDANSWERFESWIDMFSGRTEKKNVFVRPGTNELSARLHVCRSVCRRLEREMITLSESEKKLREEALIYVNRLSDLFFAMANRVA